ncbi:MAG: F0F1 ATP synthase subunit alpha, partial [Thermoanaerobaculia bacterium]|nr:F0F1 ATP synthase subunit alpha [Thermoanaerobaculia bacterium]
GERMVELLKQPQYSPYPVEEQIVSIFAGTKGHFDDVEVADVPAAEKALLDHVRHEFPELLEELRAGRKMSDEFQQQLSQVISDFLDHHLREKAGEESA